MRKTRQMHSRGKDKIMKPKLLTILAVLGCVALMTGCEPNVPDTSNTTPNITITNNNNTSNNTSESSIENPLEQSSDTNVDTSESGTSEAEETTSASPGDPGDPIKIIDTSPSGWITAIENIDNKKITWGPGVQVDSANRPVACVQLQEDYGSIASHFIGNENEKVIYLTFDAGYSNEYTAQILNVLKEKNAKAIFFVTYDYCKSVPDQVKQIIADGHVLANHTYSHPSLPECSVKEVAEEIALLHNYVYENFGYEMNLIRPPKGEFSKRTLTVAQKMGYQSIFWSFAYNDWDLNNQPDPKASYQKITSATHNGAIVLLHAVSKTNADILPDLIDYWRNNGYMLKTEF